MTEVIFNKLEGVAHKIFFSPKLLHPYESIVLGVKVKGKKQKAVNTNTYRGFHRVNKSLCGAMSVYDNEFIVNKKYVLDRLSNISDRTQLDEFSDELCDRIYNKLSNIKINQLESYNKIRKPIDLYLEHIVSMSSELSVDKRIILSSLLFLPLDSWIFSSDKVFSIMDLNDSLLKNKLNRNSTYSSVKNKSDYMVLQKIISEKSLKLGGDFHPIYFDMFWNDRWEKTEARNLFETNP